MALAGDLATALDPVSFASGLGFEAEPWESRLMRSRAARALVLCARQVGKTQTVSFRALHTALYNAGRDVLIVSPTQRQSDEMLLRVSSLYRAMREAPRLRRDNTSEMGLSNGSRIVSLPGSEGGIRGFSRVKLLVLDEASRIPDDVFASVLPMVASDGMILALSTPWGRRGWFYELHEDATNGWERHKVTVYESAQYSPQRIAEVRKALGSFVFASDYECVFGDTETQLFGTEAVRAAFSSTVRPLEL
ncbi:terminase large subunit domain-containing protein [Microbacterium lacticum]